MDNLKKVIESHCEDLEKCANILSEYKEFKETVSEMRLAVKELKEAMQQQAQVQQKPYAYVEKNNGLIPLYVQPKGVRRLNRSGIDKLRDAVVGETATFIPYHIFEIVAEATMDACGIPKET